MIVIDVHLLDPSSRSSVRTLSYKSKSSSLRIHLHVSHYSHVQPFRPQIAPNSPHLRYVLGQGLGGIFFPPFSEAFGRKTLYVTSTLLYSIFCVIAASVPSFAAVIVARFITGVLSAIPTIVVAGSIEDIYNMQARVWMIFCWALVGNLGLVLGPIFSTYIAHDLNW